MDECPWDLRKPLLDCLKKIKSDNAVVKIFITSRFMENIIEYQTPFITDEIKANRKDIDGYIKNTINEYPKYLEEFRELIHKVVRERSRDMFIIVRLHMEALIHVQVKAQVRPTLEKLPMTLDGTYESTFQRIQQKETQSKDIAEWVIALVSYAIDPLSIRELRHALATIMTINKDNLFDEDDMVEQDDITNYCCGLIVIDIDRDVRFVHRSAHEYFEKMKTHIFPDFDYQMALACTKYLTLCATSDPGDFKIRRRFTDQIDKRKEIERPITEKLKDFPFAVYAGKNLHLHIHRARHLLEESSLPGTNNKLSEWIQQLVHKTPSRQLYSCLLHQFEAYYSKSDVLDDYNVSIVSNRTTTLGIIHMAAFLGSKRLVEKAIKSIDVNDIDCHGQSALVVAFKNNLDDIAEILLDHGATVNLLTRKGHALLLFAAERNYSKVVEKIVVNVPNDGSDGLLKIFGLVLILVGTLLELLVQALNLQAPKNIEPVKPETRDGTKIMYDHSLDDYRRLLSFASQGQCEDLDDLFADLKIDLQLIEYEDSSSDKSKPSSVFYRSYRSYEDMLDYSSEDSSDEDRIKDESNGSESYNEDMSIKGISIYPGSKSSSIESAQSESDKDEDGGINKLGNIFQEDITVIQGLNQNAVKALFIKTAYFLAIERGQCGALKSLLRNTIDINLRNYQYQSLLHRATATNNEEMVRIVLEKKPEVDCRDDNGRTALMAYADLKREKVLQILLHHGARINLTHRHGSYELFAAARFGAIEVVRFYLKNEVNPSIANYFGLTPLHAAAANGHLEIVRHLLEAKANHSAISSSGLTPLNCSKSGIDWFNDPENPGKRHYSYVKSQQKNFSPEDLIERRNMIESVLRRAGAKTSAELLRDIGEDQFKYGLGGQYSHNY
ncbi:d3f9d0ed-282c-4192-9c77-9b2d3a97da13 [Sclerotinia trifoliorum]|uniref:D3f9d0ed-282c-4192-9c77-9b2d3a97da13 n=1 Tax=Sclerotinia trifoliorum TaxID=28548 RepID=A0A8H2W338_9HELO|nr:d3f9d0ed-282c-4192-9c77-9b2d3a97da13 [Sclerotinia trifoliorum]